MAIDAIHASFFRGGNLFRTERPGAIDVFSHIAIAIFHSNPRNDLSLSVGSDKGDLIGKIHMPVNSRYWTTRRIATTDINQHPCLPQRVLLVVGVVIKRLELSTVKLRGPMTLLARLIGRPHIVNRRLDRSGIVSP